MKREDYQDIWGKSYGNELRRLAQGIGYNIKGTDTLFSEQKNVSFKRRRDITYGQIVCDYWEGKEDTNREILFVGGNKLKSAIDWSTPTSDLFTVKLLLNSVVLTEEAKFFTLNRGLNI